MDQIAITSGHEGQLTHILCRPGEVKGEVAWIFCCLLPGAEASEADVAETVGTPPEQAALRYVELNPVRAGIVESAAGWRWSRPRPWFRRS